MVSRSGWVDVRTKPRAGIRGVEDEESCGWARREERGPISVK